MYIVPGSMHQASAAIGKELGDSLVLEAPVTSISHDSAGVTVVSEKGTWQGAHTIVALPLPLSSRIRYQPPLPPEREALTEQMPMGSVIKYWVAYEKPFWREHGMNGLLFTDTPPSSFISEASPPEGKPGFLVGFIDGRRALHWNGRPMEERKKMAVDLIVKYFGPEGARPIDYIDQDWPADPWSRAVMVRPWGPASLPLWAQLCVPASDAFTGQERRHLRFGRGTSKAPFAPVSGLPLRSSRPASKIQRKR